MAEKEKFELYSDLDSPLNEDSALALLSAADVAPETCGKIAKNGDLLKSRKVKVALVCHPRTPRHVSVPIARQLYTLDLMKVALSPTVISDIKVAVDGILISRLKTISVGERLTLARRATGRVAAALLLDVGSGSTNVVGVQSSSSEEANSSADPHVQKCGPKPKIIAKDTRVMQAALENPRLTEALVIKALLSPQATISLIDGLAKHKKWSKERDVRAALLRTESLSLAKALDYSRDFQTPALLEVLTSSRLPEPIKELLVKENRDIKRDEKA